MPLKFDKTPQPGRDVPVSQPITGTRADEFVGLFVPGGYSPGFLEKDPEAVRVVREFLDAKKPVGLICHAPRILIKNGLAGGRTLTTLFTVPDELADEWTARSFRYLDRPVILDGNLLTSRYPKDAPAFAWRFLELLAAHGGISPQPRPGQVVFILTNNPDGGLNYHFDARLRAAIETFGGKFASAGAHDAKYAAELLAKPHALLALDVSPEQWAAAPQELKDAALAASVLVAGESMKPLLAERKLPTTWVPAREIDLWARAIEATLPETPTPYVKQNDGSVAHLPPIKPDHPSAEIPAKKPLPSVKATSPDKAAAVFALKDGFDDESLVAWVGAAKVAGKEPVAFLSNAKGKVKGVNGLEVEASASYDSAPPTSPSTWVVAPGFFWPQKNSEARQAEQPAWIEEQAAKDAVRNAWLLAARDQGATLILTGLDALNVGKLPSFAGKPFSTTAQAVWSFPKEGAKFSPDPATLSDERLLTVRAADDVPAAIDLLSKPTSPTP